MKARPISAERQHPLGVLKGEREKGVAHQRERKIYAEDKVGFALVRFCADALWGAKLTFAALPSLINEAVF